MIGHWLKLPEKQSFFLEKQGEIKAAFEIKAKKQVGGNDFSGFGSFCANNPKVPCFFVCEVDEPYKEESVEVLPCSNYLKRLPDFL